MGSIPAREMFFFYFLFFIFFFSFMRCVPRSYLTQFTDCETFIHSSFFVLRNLNLKSLSARRHIRLRHQPSTVVGLRLHGALHSKSSSLPRSAPPPPCVAMLFWGGLSSFFPPESTLRPQRSRLLVPSSAHGQSSSITAFFSLHR